MVTKNKKIPFLLMIGILILAFASGLMARQNPADVSGQALKKAAVDKYSRTLFNISNWAYWLYYDGMSAQTPNGDSGGIYPRGTTGVIFTDGIVWGGYVMDGDTSKPSLRVGGQTYNIGTTPGWIETAGDGVNPPVAISADDPRARIYRIRQDYASLVTTDKDGNTVYAASVKQDAAEVNFKSSDAVTPDDMAALVAQYETDWKEWPVDLGAPYYDEDGNGAYDPVLVNGVPQIGLWDNDTKSYSQYYDRPGTAGADQVVWFVVNDLTESRTLKLYGSPSIGMELQVTAWGYNQPNSTLGQMLFKKFKFINKSGYNIDSMFVAQWSDPDLGNYADDLAGCDVDLSLGFAYNGFRTDSQFDPFGLPPAAVGYDFFQGPMVDGVAGQDLNRNGVDDADDYAVFGLQKQGPGKINLPMTSFLYFAAGSALQDPPLGDYEGTKQWYNMLNGYTPTSDLTNPTPYTIGNIDGGTPTKYPLAGDPFLGTGDIDGQGTNLPPADRRLGLATGPFNMAPGDEQELVVAVVGGIIEQDGGDNRNAVAQLKLNDAYAQFLYNNLFQGVPSPPSAPSVTASEFEHSIVLDWGSNAKQVAETERDDPLLGFNFQGYNVYQLPSETASKTSAKLVATFDVVDRVGIIRAKQFLPSFGDVVTVPVQYGTDSGIQRFFTIEKDYINELPLYNGQTYYFAVTAYNYNADPNVPEQSLETSLTPIAVVPQSATPGVKYGNTAGDVVEVEAHSTSTGSAEVTVVDPSKLITADYKIEFGDEKQYTVDAAGDTIGTWYAWNIRNVQADTLILAEDQTNLSGDDQYLTVNGMLVKAIGPKAAGYADWDYSGSRWYSGVNWGGPGLFGGLDVGANFFGSTLTAADLVPIRMEFQDQADIDANGYASQGRIYRRDAGYGAGNIGNIPFACYDVKDPANPRKVNICFVESDGQDGAAANDLWDMGWTGTEFPGTVGAREYLFIMKSDYNGGVDYDNTNWGPAADVLYAIWPKSRGSHAYVEAKFEMNIYANLPNTPDDYFTFSTTGATTGDESLTKDAVENVNVFPNPYYAYNPAEPNRFTRYVTFTHLTSKATIRIFDLAGTQVRKLEKDDPSQFLRWDLRNESDIPVASGIYIAHIDLPEAGKTKILKVFIIQAQEMLKYY